MASHPHLTRPRPEIRFRDRREAGRVLAAELQDRESDDPIVVALPRGGVPVGYEVALTLHAPLDIMLVRKLGAPGHPELGIGAVGEDEEAIVDPQTLVALGVTRSQLEDIVERERVELRRRAGVYRPGQPQLDVEGRNVLLVDDGLATGGTATAAARVLRARGAMTVTLAIPVGPPSAEQALRDEFDSVVCLYAPRNFVGVGGAYADFSQTSDEEVMELLGRASDPARIPSEPVVSRRVSIPAKGGVELTADLVVPEEPLGLVVFAHGSGSSRRSRRNRAVAARLNGVGLATLLLDLLTPAEASRRENVFDVDLLADRVLAAQAWASEDPDLGDLPLSLFGASTGAAAALKAAAHAGERIVAVVSRGGRPDLAGSDLARVTTPTLLVVGGADGAVLDLNRQASKLLGGPCEVAVIPGAGHLFEEAGALERVTSLASEWFLAHLSDATPSGVDGTG